MGLLLFVHLTGIALWLGGMAALVVLSAKTIRSKGSEALRVTLDAAKTVIYAILNPAAVAVLATGITMIVQMNLTGIKKPFWLSFMEQVGGMVALISVALLTLYVRRIAKADSDDVKRRGLALLNWFQSGIGAAVVVTIYIVARRLGS